MQRKPVIGLNADFRTGKDGHPSYSVLPAGYYNSIAAAGGIPTILPPIDNEDDIGQLLERLDGFVLVGGADLDPRNDGFMLHASMRLMENRRESFDRMLVRLLSEMRVPTFGIGAGMQLLNVALGGNLFFHLPEDVPSAIPHRDPQDPGHRHSLDIAPDSLLERVYGDGEIRVASRHHMAVDEVAPMMRVTARCPDGVIEGFESTNPDWFVLGTQFHPESEAASALDVRIFEEFIDGVREQVPATIRMVA